MPIQVAPKLSDVNPQNSTSPRFDLFILNLTPSASYSSNALFWHANWGAAGLAYFEKEAVAHVTFSSGSWADYGISVVSNITDNEISVAPVPDEFFIGASAGTSNLYPPPSNESPQPQGSQLFQDDIDAGQSVTIPRNAVWLNLNVQYNASVLGPGSVTGTNTDAGTVSYATIGTYESPGYFEVTSGGTADAILIADASNDRIDVGGSITSAVVEAGSIQTLYGSGSLSVIQSLAIEYVEAGAVSELTQVLSGAIEVVSSGGIASAFTVSSGGLVELAYGALATQGVVLSGGLAEIAATISTSITLLTAQAQSATLISGVTLSSGGLIEYDGLNIVSGGVAVDPLGGLVIGATINAGAVLRGGGVLEGYVSVEGSVSGVVFGSAVAQDQFAELDVGGTLTSVTATAGEVVIEAGASVNALTVASGAFAIVSSGAITSAVQVQSGGSLLFDTVSGNTQDVIGSGGTVVFASATAGSGSIFPTAGRISSDTTISGITLKSGSVVQYEQLSASGGGTPILVSGTNLSGLTVAAGTTVSETSGTDIASAAVSSGGLFQIASGSEVEAGLTVYFGGQMSGAGTFLGSGTVAGTVTSLSLTLGDDAPPFLEIISGGAARSISVLAGTLQLDGGSTASGDRVGGSVSTEFVQNELLESGAFDSAAVISSGGTLIVLSGGSEAGAVVSSGGAVIVSSGGQIGATTILSGGDITFAGYTVSSGGTLPAEGIVTSVFVISGVTLQSGALVVYDQVTINPGPVVSLTSSQILNDVNVQGTVVGGEIDGLSYLSFHLSGATIGSSVTPMAGVTQGASLEIEPNGSASNILLASGETSVQIDNGATATGVTVNSGAVLNVAGVASAVYIDQGGYEGINDEGSEFEGTSFNTIVSNGGAATIFAHGSAISAVILSGGEITVSCGGYDLVDAVSQGGVLEVLSGANESYLTVGGGGTAVISAGAAVSSSTVMSGGSLDISEVISTAALLVGDGVVQHVTFISGATVSSGGVIDYDGLEILSGGTGSLGFGQSLCTVLVSAGGALTGGGSILGADDIAGSISGIGLGVIVGPTAEAADVELFAGGTASSVVVIAGELQVDVQSIAVGTLLSAMDGGENVAGLAIRTLVYSGSTDRILAGGLGSNAVVSVGGQQDVCSGGVANGTVVDSGGLEVLSSGAIVSGVVVSSGGIVELEAVVSGIAGLPFSGAVSSTTVVGGVTVLSGGIIDYEGAVATSGATLTVSAGSIGFGLTIAQGASLSGPGDVVENNYAAGAVVNVTIGSSAGATPGLYGELELQSGATASALKVQDGELVVDEGATASGISLLSSILSDVEASVYGSASGVSVQSGASNEVQSGGFTTGDLISAGGVEYVALGGSVAGTTISSGGLEVLYTGATASGLTVLSGGAVDFVETIATSISLPSTMTVASSLVMSGVTISSGGLVEYTGATVVSGGVLTLSSSASLANVDVAFGGELVGAGSITGENYVAGFLSGVAVGVASGLGASAGDLEIQFGGFGSSLTVQAGEVVVDTGASAQGISLGASTEDDVYGATTSTVVSSGAIEFVAGGGTAVGTIVSSGGEQMVASGGVVSGTSVRSGGLESLALGAAALGVTVVSGRTLAVEAVISGSSGLPVGGPVTSVTTISGVKLFVGGQIDYTGYLVASGASLNLSSGSVASNVIELSGGTLSGVGVLGDGGHRGRARQRLEAWGGL